MTASAIEWTDETWNPVIGCDRVSPGCAHCYALELAPRLRMMQQARGGGVWADQEDGGRRSGPAFAVRTLPDRLEDPLRWRKPRMVFVNSMSDLFHEQVPFEFIAAVLGVMAAAEQHTFQVLTKRPERMLEFFAWYGVESVERECWDQPGELAQQSARSAGVDERWLFSAPTEFWPLPNVWLGVSIENRRFVSRADVLRRVPAAVRFISAEPLLGPLVPKWGCYCFPDVERAWRRPWPDGYVGPPLSLGGIDWLIVGGESGPTPRPVHEKWVRDLRDACAHTGTAFFFKQWGGVRPGGVALLDGRAHREFPAGQNTAMAQQSSSGEGAR